MTSVRRPAIAQGRDADTLAVHVGPERDPLIERAVLDTGSRLVPLDEAEAAVWTSLDPATWVAARPPAGVRWVQLLSAGVERWIETGVAGDGRTWTSAAGASDLTVAEHALGLLIAVRRRFVECARAERWNQIEGLPLRGATALIVGCGAIGRALIPMLAALEVDVIAVTRSGRQVHGAIESHSANRLPSLWPRADLVIVAAPSTPQTRNIVDRAALSLMPDHAVLVNVARGALVDTDALVEALTSGGIAGAGLDVTEPEPLPDGHPLWSMPNVLITPHDANPEIAWKANVAQRVVRNIRRFLAGEELIETIDLRRNY